MANLTPEKKMIKLCDVPIGSQIRFEGTPIVYTKIKTPKNAKTNEDGMIQNLTYGDDNALAYSHPNSERMVEVVSLADKPKRERRK